MYRIVECVDKARAAGYTVTTRAVDAAAIHVCKPDFYQRFTGIGAFVAWVCEHTEPKATGA